jgi:hypothetical protein
MGTSACAWPQPGSPHCPLPGGLTAGAGEPGLDRAQIVRGELRGVDQPQDQLLGRSLEKPPQEVGKQAAGGFLTRDGGPVEMSQSSLLVVDQPRLLHPLE